MKKLLFFTAFSIVLISAIAQTPKITTKKPAGCKLKIGDTHAGGIIFWLDPDDSCHGLVCAPYDQSNNTQWYDAINMEKNLKYKWIQRMADTIQG